MARKSSAPAEMAGPPAGTAVVEEAGPSRKKLTITIPGDEVTQTLEASIASVMSEAALPGFRPGRVPRRLIEKRFGSAVKQEAKNQLLSTAYSRALEEHKLRPLGDPEGAEALEQVELEPGRAITFTLEIEVPPEFELPNLEGIEVLRPLIEVQDKDIDTFLGRIQINDGRLEPRDAAEPGDYCIGHGVMKNDAGEVIHDIQGAVIQVPPPEKKGEGAVLGVKVDDFGAQIGLPKNGDTLTIRATGPENHENAKVRGRKLEVTFEVGQINRIVPATVEELMTRYGLADEGQLRESIRLRLDARARVEQQVAMRGQIARTLGDMVTMTLPERMTERQAARHLERARLEMLYRGMDPRQVEEKLTEMRSATAANAARELKLFFILARAAELMKIQVTEEEVQGRLAQLASERGVRPDQLLAEIQQRNQGAMLVQQIREHKTLDALLAKAKITDMPVDEFNAMMAKKAGERVQLA